jgi:hypothetical protein
MLPPDQRLLEADLQSAEFRIGVVNGYWGQAEPGVLTDGAAWPKVFFWMKAAPRPNAPERYYVELDLSGYRSVAPTGPFWDPTKKIKLELAKWPKGKPNSRVAMVFRTNGFSAAGNAFYHPYDRAATRDHAQWATQIPHRVWTSSHTIVDYLAEFHALLNCGDYVGV